MPNILTPRSEKPLIRWWWSLDRLSFGILIALAIFGVVMVWTASPSVATRIGLDSNHFLFRHIMFLIPSMAAMVGLAWLKPKEAWRFATVLYAVAFIGVIMTLVHGDEIKGAMRWVRLFGFSIQPSEFIKPAFILLSAWFLSRQKLQKDFPGIMIALGLYGVTAAVLLMQPDFGMFFLLSCVFGMQIFLSGCPLRYIAVLGMIGVVGIGLVYMTFDHVQSRIDRFLFPEGADTYQIDRSKEAFMNGGLLGTGPGQGTVKNQVPDVHSDFIFTAMGEEWGFVFTTFVVGLYAFLFYRLFTRFARSESLFIVLGGGGLTFMLVVQCFIHMGSTLQLIPAKGMTLPLISYGGSSLIAVGVSLGLILALSRGIVDDRKRATWRHLTKKEF